MKTFAVGDIHGAYGALMQCLERSGFDREKDRLIAMGDVCDRCPDVRQCIDELLKIRRCDLIAGNHDMWVLGWALRGEKPEIWTSQGGDLTIASYGGGPMPQAHIDFLKGARLWIERDGQLFVHGGFDPKIPLSSQGAETLAWDRNLFEAALRMRKVRPKYKFGRYSDIFIGHTPTGLYDTLEPVHACNVWNIDTGSGCLGRLTIMDVDSKEYWQSDPAH